MGDAVVGEDVVGEDVVGEFVGGVGLCVGERVGERVGAPSQRHMNPMFGVGAGTWLHVASEYPLPPPNITP